jgi:hypothetical protein
MDASCFDMEDGTTGIRIPERVQCRPVPRQREIRDYLANHILRRLQD